MHIDVKTSARSQLRDKRGNQTDRLRLQEDKQVLGAQTATSRNKGRLGRNGGCMYVFSRICLFSFALMIIGLSAKMFYRNHQALGWPQVPIVISGSQAQASYDEDSETGEKTWSIDVKLHFTGTFEGKPIAGSFWRSSRFGNDQPTPDEVESRRLSTLNGYQRDGLTAHVNPQDTSETMVEPSLIGPAFMFLFGVGLLILFIRKHDKILEDD